MTSLKVALGTAFEPVEAPAHEALWYAVQTSPRYEKKIVSELCKKGVESFLPLCPEKHRWSDREKVVEVPLFPQYVFVRITGDTTTRISVLRTPGVNCFVGARGIGVTIPESQIAAVQSVLEQRLSATPHSFLNAGQRVRIRGGSLDGVEGILLGLKGAETLVISVDLIQRSLTISVKGFTVEPV